jgi:hypothetical protein
LEDAIAGANGTGEGGAFLECVRDRLFKIDVFAGGERVESHADVPVVGCGDEDGVERLIEHPAIVRICGSEAVGAKLNGIAMRSVDVAHRGNLIASSSVGGGEQAAHAAAGADHADAKRVVGAENTSGSEGGKSSGDNEAATIQFV